MYATTLLTIVKLQGHYLFQLHTATTCVFADQQTEDEVTLRHQLDQFAHLLNDLLPMRLERTAGRGESDPLAPICHLLYNRLLPLEIQMGLAALPAGAQLSIATNDNSVPWELLHDGVDYLALRYIVGRRLMLTTARRRTAPVTSKLWNSLLIGNPTGDLPSANYEIEQVAQLIEATPGAAVARVLMFSRATKESVLHELASGVYHLIHYAGHVYVDPHEPDRSGLVLAHGDILNAAEIRQHLAGQPVVLLNGCESARTFATNQEPTAIHDIATAFVCGGARVAVGTIWPVHDTLSSALALNFLRHALSGEAVAAALRQARIQSHNDRLQAPLWASYLLYGEPDETLAIARRAENRTVTVFAARLVAAQSNESTTEWMPAFVETITLCIERFGGRLVSVIDNEAVAAFGIDSSQANDGERALMAALLLRETLASYPSVYSYTMGVASGKVLLYPIGAASTMALAGRPVEEARQLAAQGSAGTILAAEPVRRLTRHLFAFASERPALRIAEQPPGYALLVHRRESQDDEVEHMSSSPFVGRQRELAQLFELWRQCNQVEAEGQSTQEKQRSRILDILGEAGLGKSRLVDEFRRTLPASSSTFWCAVACPTAYTPAPNWLVGQLLQRLLAISPTLGADTRQEIETVLDNVLHIPPETVERSEYLALLSDLLGMTWEDALRTPSDGGAWRYRLVALLRRLLAWRCESQPMVIAIDNAQWADEASLELLPLLANATDKLPLFWIVNLRSPFSMSEPWGSRRNHHLLQLAPLDNSDAAGLIAAMLKSGALDASLQSTIQRAAGGNPLFLREFVTSLAEAGVLERQAGMWRLARPLGGSNVPNTVQHVIRLRIDGLPATAQQLLPLLSVAGDRSELRLLEYAWSGDRAALYRGLAELEHREFITYHWDDEVYEFTHGLIQDEVYSTMLGEERRRYHRLVGRSLETLYAGQETTLLDRLAHHFYRSVILPAVLGGNDTVSDDAHAEDLNKAMGYLAEAASQANRRYAARQAVALYNNALLVAIALAHHQPVSCVAFHIGKGDAAELLGEFEAARHSYQAAFAELIQTQPASESRRAGADLARRLGRLAGRLGDYEQAHEQMKQALVLLGEPVGQSELAVAALTYTHTGSLYVWEGKLANAEEVCRRALALLGEWERGAVTATAANVLGVVCEMTGKWDEARDRLQQSCTLWNRLGDRHQLALVSDNLGTLYFYRGDFEQAASIYRQNLAFWEGLEATDEMGHALLNLGGIHLVHQEWDEASHYYRRALTLFAQTKNDRLLALANNNLGYLALAQARYGEAKDLFTMSLKGDPNAEYYRGLSEALAALGEWKPALTAAKKALTLARTEEVVVEEGAALRTLGMVYAGRGQWKPALSHLEESRQLLTRLGARYEQARTLASLAEVLDRLGRYESAQRYRSEANALFAGVGVKARG